MGRVDHQALAAMAVPVVTSESELRRRRHELRRLLLENVPMDSPAYERHAARLARARTPDDRMTVYEDTLREAGVL